MAQVYHGQESAPSGNVEHRSGPASFRRQLEAVKEGVRIECVAADYGEFRRLGNGQLLGSCVSPDHEDKTPSMTVYPETQTFKCYGIGCGAQGDVLDLVMLAEGCTLWEAMVDLSVRYGIALPKRPQSWYAKQHRQKPVRNAIEETRKRIFRRRAFRWVILPDLAEIEDEDERYAEIEAAWQDFETTMRRIGR